MTTDLLVRELAIHGETSPGSREFTGIAVPWDTPAAVFDWDRGAYNEVISRGAVQDSDDAKVFYRHGDVIGKITANRDTDDGWEITAYISETERGNEAYTLLRDGVIDKLSIGFREVEHTETAPEVRGDRPTITRTKIQVREISLVPFPAYETANVTAVRSQSAPPINPAQEQVMPQPTDYAAQLAEIRESQDDFQRKVNLMITERDDQNQAPAQFRSAGEALKAIVAGDDEARAEYEALVQRAYTGATLADSIANSAWVGDLTRLSDQASPLSDLFSTGTLPADGMKIEFARLKANTVEAAKQAEEGDALKFGKIEIDTGSASVETYGGYTELSRQTIDRSSIAYLDHTLRALAIAIGKHRATSLRAALAATRAAQVTAGNTVNAGPGDTWAGWFGAIVDAAEKYEDLGLSMSEVTMTTDKSIFKILGGLTDSAGRPLFNVTGTGVNTVGTINPSVIDANLANLKIRLNAKQAAPGATLGHPLAIRSYNSPAVTLQDNNVVNLSNQFSAYAYGAIADEMPGAIIPVTIAPAD